MKKWNKLLALLLAMVMAFGMTATALAEGEAPAETPDKAPAETTETEPVEGEETKADPAADGEIVIVHTNDVHCGYEAYDKVATVAATADLLLDAGDAIAGGPVGSLSEGSYVVDIMNYLGYDAAAPGNHEFDFTREVFMNIVENEAEFPYLSCNFVDLKTGETVLDAYKIFEVEGKKVAVVGISTPETPVKSSPVFFQDEEKNYIYGFCGKEKDGSDLYAAVQTAVDAARAEGADYVIGLAHLGIDKGSEPWTSNSVAANTTGMDVLIDGHSHSTFTETVKNKAGKEVVVAQTGTKLANIGKITIKADGTITAENVETKTVEPNAEATAFIAGITEKFSEIIATVVAKSDVPLLIEGADGKRAVRSGETNLGDLCADAYRTVLGADIGVVNGGGVRESLPAGELTYGDIITVHPYSNMACLVEVTGQQIKDALEMSVKDFPGESGGFLQVSGLTYNINTGIPSSVKLDEEKCFISVEGEYRVSDIMVGGEPLDVEKTYTLASHNYMLKQQGDGFTMFGEEDIKILKDEVLVDNQVLINYIVDELGGVVGQEYAKPQGRITVNGCTDITANNWYYGAVTYATEKGLIDAVDGAFLPNEAMTRADFVTALYRLAGSPEVTGENVFTDVADDAAYKNAVIWANACGYVTGNPDGTFAPDATLQRQHIAAILYRAVKPEAADADLSVFTDADKIQGYATEAVKWMVAQELLKGSPDNTIDARGTISRAQVATILQRFEEKGLTFAPIEETPAEGEAEKPAEGETEKPTEGETEKPTEGETEKPAEGETEKPTEEQKAA